MVARLIRNPVTSNFVHVKPEWAPGEFRLLAGEALRTKSLLKGKLILALCLNKAPRAEIGDVLLADLVKMVDQIMVEQAAQIQD